MNKQNKGITLIALIITIVILLILSAVVINVIIGDNGLFKIAKNAVTDYKTAEQNERNELDRLYSSILIADNGTVTFNKEELKSFIQANANPTGTVITYMSGTSAPKGYLACDGTVYNVSDYPDLAESIRSGFGSYNYYGGDGVTTFAVPDLRGEFLRGAGNNSRTDQGNGAAVGIHQNATEHVFFGYNGSNDWYVQNSVSSGSSVSAYHCDRLKVDPSGTGLFWRATGTFTDTRRTYYTSRPTNTSVLYCIKY